ncbi:TonB-dependent vitamin B12 receptor [Uliginosibacterium sediminicola]|uniref:TonB-dependent vitamin B12 receptor n=1 Tax=Uliginosibacterium sediminicola TaxID=2024550 RepID=A0ABU9YXA3_9RHOO
MLVLPAACLLGTSPALYAQQTQNKETQHETVVVTANRVARTVDETLAPVSVLTRQDIERLQAQSLPDLLRGLPGVSFANNGGPGKATSLFLRGTNSDHVLVLVDGFKIGSATSGGASLQDIPVDQIERIEIVRGPRASLYGSDAIGGVIQIFTRKGQQAPGFALTSGSRHTFGASAQGGFGSKDLWASAGVKTDTTRGINVCQGTTSASCSPDRDGYANTAFNLHAGAHLTDKLDAELIALQIDNHNEFDGSSQDNADGRQQVFGGTFNYQALDRWLSSLRIGQTTDDSRNYLGERYKSRFTTRRDSLNWQNDIELAAGHQLVAGVDLTREKILSTTNYAVRSRTNNAVFLQYLADIGAFSAQLSGRRDNNEQFGSHNTGGLATGYTFSKWLRLTASYATAFKAPTFNQLYFPSYGTATLQPEKSRNREIGAGGAVGNGKWQLSVFDNHINQLIVTDPVSFTAVNLSSARIHGIELSAEQQFGQTRVAASTTLQNPKDHSGSNTEGNLLVRRARQMARVDVDHDLGAWSVGSSWNGVGKRYDNDTSANTIVHLGGYSTWDLRTEYRIDKSWRVQLRGENVFNKRYETAYLYNQTGAGVFVTLRYQAL